MLQPVIFIEDKRLCLEELERISLLQEKMHKSSWKYVWDTVSMSTWRIECSQWQLSCRSLTACVLCSYFNTFFIFLPSYFLFFIFQLFGCIESAVYDRWGHTMCDAPHLYKCDFFFIILSSGNLQSILRLTPSFLVYSKVLHDIAYPWLVCCSGLPVSKRRLVVLVVAHWCTSSHVENWKILFLFYWFFLLFGCIESAVYDRWGHTMCDAPHLYKCDFFL